MNMLKHALTVSTMAVVFLLLAPLAAAQTIGTVVMVRGDVTAENPQGEVRTLSRRGEVLVGDLLNTGPDARLQIRMIDNALIDLRPETALRMEVYQGESATTEDRVLMDLVNGTLSTLTGTFGRSTDDAYEVRAASATIGIRGTAYGLFNDSNNNSVFTTVTNGIIFMGSPNGSILLGPTQPFRNGRIVGNQPPQGLLLPPQELLDALLTGNDDGTEGDENGDTNGDTDTAGAPPVEGDINDPQRDNESVTGGTLLTSGTQQTQPPTQENQLSFIDRRLSSSEQTAVTTSTNLFFGSGALGANMTSAQGVMVFRPTIGKDNEILLDGFAAIYNDGKPSFANGYVPADSILRLNPDAQGENVGYVWSKEGYSVDEAYVPYIDYEEFQLQVAEDGPDSVANPAVSWGSWDMTDHQQSGTYLYDNYDSANATQELGGDVLWYVIGTPDQNINWSSGPHSFSSSIIYGTDQNGASIQGGFFSMEVSTTGIASSGLLEVETDGWWIMDQSGTIAIVNGTLDMDFISNNDSSFLGTGSVNGLFNQDNYGDNWFFGTYDLESVDGENTVNGVIVAPEGEGYPG